MEEVKKWPVTAILAALNVAMYFVITFTGRPEDTMHMIRLGAAYTPYILEGEWYRLFTAMFLHFGFAHLANNMLVLAVLGMRLEGLMGHVRLALIYLLGGIGGNIVSMWMECRSGSFAVSAGASGAAFALTGAMLWLALRNRGRAGDLTTRQVLIMAAMSLYLGFASSGVNNAAHIGGLICGFVLAMLLCPHGGTGRRYNAGI